MDKAVRTKDPFVYNAPVPPSCFIGRADEIDRILSQLANPARSSSAIFGSPRLGKTSLLHHLPERHVCEAWGLTPDWCHFLYLDCHSIVPFSEEAFWRYTLRELKQHVRDDKSLTGNIQRLLAQASPDIYDLNNFFDNIARAGRLVVLLLDEFEGAVEHLDRNAPELLYHLRALLNRPERGLALVAASREPLKQLCAHFRFVGSPFDNSFVAITLPPFSNAEVDQLLDQAQANFSSAERTYLRQVTGNHPYLVQLTASLILRARGDYKATFALMQIEAELEREAEGYFSDLLSYTSEREQMLLVWLALAQLGQHLPAVGRVKLGDLSRVWGHYDPELTYLVKRGLVVNRTDNPRLFSPLFSWWLLRHTIMAKGREVLLSWEPHYVNFLSSVQTYILTELVDQVIRWPAIIKTPQLLAQTLTLEESPLPPVGTNEKVLGRYIIEDLIGEGGVADVFKAWDPHLDRLVAIKKLRASLSRREEVRARFRREAQAIAALRHPHIVQVHDFDIQNGHYYMVMEFIQGHNLQKYLHPLEASGQTLPWLEVLRILTPVADALDYAHRREMIHRDIKPSNILLADDGGVFLADFGLVRLLGQADLIQSGKVIGTLAYMSPEQILGANEEIDHRADIYALGCTVYEMMTGRPPFRHADLPMAHLNADPPAPHLIVPTLPEAVSQIIMKALAKDRAERPLSASQFIQNLREALRM